MPLPSKDVVRHVSPVGKVPTLQCDLTASPDLCCLFFWPLTHHHVPTLPLLLQTQSTFSSLDSPGSPTLSPSPSPLCGNPSCSPDLSFMRVLHVTSSIKWSNEAPSSRWGGVRLPSLGGLGNMDLIQAFLPGTHLSFGNGFS